MCFLLSDNGMKSPESLKDFHKLSQTPYAQTHDFEVFSCWYPWAILKPFFSSRWSGFCIQNLLAFPCFCLHSCFPVLTHHPSCTWLSLFGSYLLSIHLLFYSLPTLTSQKFSPWTRWCYVRNSSASCQKWRLSKFPSCSSQLMLSYPVFIQMTYTP